MRSKSKKRIELGEEGWKEYQKERDREKSRKCYKRNISHTSRWRLKLKRRLIEYKGGKCQQCGYNKDVLGAYTFHHRNPSEKKFSISRYPSGLNVLMKEADKCDLLCCNCHAEVHDDVYKYDRKEFQKAVVTPIQPRKCTDCSKTFTPKKRDQKYCDMKCRAKVKNRPSKTELKKLIADLPWTRIGEKYGVSDNAVRKWARTYELL